MGAGERRVSASSDSLSPRSILASVVPIRPGSAGSARGRQERLRPGTGKGILGKQKAGGILRPEVLALNRYLTEYKVFF